MTPETVDVGPGVGLLPRALLGGHVLRGAEECARRGQSRAVLGIHELRDREVQDPRLQIAVLLAQDHVGGFQVAVKDTAAMRGLDSFGDLSPDPRRFADGQPSDAFDPLAQGLASYQLHDDVGVPLGQGAVVIEVRDVGMPDAGDGAGLASEPLPGLGVGDHVVPEELDRDGPVELDVAALVDGPHAAPRDQSLQPVLSGDQETAQAGQHERLVPRSVQRLSPSS